MAKVFVIYGPRGAGKTTTTLKLADAVARRGANVGGYFQRTLSDEEDCRCYDLVRVSDHAQSLPLARPGGREKPGTSVLCSFSFMQDAFAAGLEWLRQDAASSRVLVLDEISKLEVRGEGHAAALRWALSLGDEYLLLLSVRAELLFYVMETFDLESCLAGYLEIPAGDTAIAAEADQIAKAFS